MNKRCLILILLLGSLLMVSCKNDKEEKNELFTGARFIKTYEAYIGDIEHIITYSGYVKFDKVIDVTPNISGKIEKIYVEEGDLVKKNQLLVRIDKNSLEQYQANFDFAERNFKRAQNLLRDKAIDLRTFEEIETQWINARTVFTFAKENLEIRAPFSGVISRVNMKENETYNPIMMSPTGDVGILRIINSEDISIDVFVSDTDLRQLKKNQRVKINANDKVYDAVVSFISPENDRMTGLNRVKVELNASDLRNNQFVLVEFIPVFKENVLIIPKAALIDEETVILSKNNRSQYRKVQTGMTNRHYVEILSGLEKGDLVIVEGNSGLEDNYPVTEFSN